MWRTKSMKSRPYAWTEWLDSSASQIQGTSAMAVADPSPVASRARARKASTLSAAGGVAFQEVAPLGQEGRAGCRLLDVRRDDRWESGWGDVVHGDTVTG